jgi:hypothetical protein
LQQPPRPIPNYLASLAGHIKPAQLSRQSTSIPEASSEGEPQSPTKTRPSEDSNNCELPGSSANVEQLAAALDDKLRLLDTALNEEDTSEPVDKGVELSDLQELLLVCKQQVSIHRPRLRGFLFILGNRGCYERVANF